MPGMTKKRMVYQVKAFNSNLNVWEEQVLPRMATEEAAKRYKFGIVPETGKEVDVSELDSEGMYKP